MEILIQNLGSSPLMVNVPAPDGKSISHTITLVDNTVTKISEEIYLKCIISSDFFKQRIADGVVRVLNASDAEDAVKQSINNRDFAYSKYIDLMKKIRSAGGMTNEDVKRFLNSDGTPTLELLNLNFGRNIDPQVAEEFRVRWNAENSEGMHEDVLKLPMGVKVDAGVRPVNVKKTENELQVVFEQFATEEADKCEEWLNGLDKEQLIELAELNEVKFRKDIQLDALVKKLMMIKFN